MSRQSVGAGAANERRRARPRPTGKKGALRILVLTGTRPDIIKTASVVHALEAAGCETFLVHSGQHEAAVSELYRFLRLRPFATLRLGPRGPQLAELNARLLESLDPIVARVAPDVLVVQGDTTTALVGALIGFYHRVPVAHVEAGLRSGDTTEPFPEELNRQLITRIATWHFAPTPLAVACLRREGVPLETVTMTGNTVVDAALFGYSRLGPRPVTRRSEAHRLIVVTAHRRENWGAGIDEIGLAMRRVVERFTDVAVLWPLHPNPEVASAVKTIWRGLSPDVSKRVTLTDPLAYPDMLQALRDAWLVVTDSGGLQEEAVTARVPVLVTRRQTERPEVITCGAGRLVGADARRLEVEVARLYRSAEKWEAMRPTHSPFGDGTAGRRIAAVLAKARQSRTPKARAGVTRPRAVAS
ncbi:MAG: non-hydrolyzing UDP-N-acetylglucosamine 2-epimerase [Acidiferrobacter sp.]